jgi:hypothetical protein
VQEQDLVTNEQYLCLEENKIYAVTLSKAYRIGLRYRYRLSSYTPYSQRDMYRTFKELQKNFTLKTRLWELLYN